MSQADDLRRLAELLDERGDGTPCPLPTSLNLSADGVPEARYAPIAQEILARWPDLCRDAAYRRAREIDALRTRLAALFAPAPAAPVAAADKPQEETAPPRAPTTRSADLHDPFEKGRKARRDGIPCRLPGGLSKTEWHAWENGWRFEDGLPGASQSASV